VPAAALELGLFSGQRQKVHRSRTSVTARAALSLDNARRYTRERATALALQRSLLPQRLPQQSAVEAASRYLPASANVGVGGDWFDVIPLSGARVALIVGDVVGHGIRASAIMGRLRTAVRTLADVDLPPDELLTVLMTWSAGFPPTRMPMMMATKRRTISAPRAYMRSTIRCPAGAA
jgi:serine phosphatase RsbU (regulator of sigma subunit)